MPKRKEIRKEISEDNFVEIKIITTFEEHNKLI